MRRTLFYQKFTVDGTEELDFLYNSLSEFTIKYPVTYYRVEESDLPDPALISYRCYGDPYFWWVILSVNGIQNPFDELTAGIILTIPNILDIYNFQRKSRVRRS